MNAIIFGATGQDGALLAKSLLRKGHSVIGVSRSPTPNLSNLVKLDIAGFVHMVSADITDFRQILEIFVQHKPEQIYNMAAQSSVAASFGKPLETFSSIINGTINILEVMRFIGYKGSAYFAGSSEIYGNTVNPATIDTVRSPRSPYAIAKDSSLNAVKLYREAYGIRCVTGILFNHESSLRPKSFVTRKIIDGAFKCLKDPTHRFPLGNLSVIRDWGWAEEYVEAIQLLIESPCLKDHIICTGRSVSLEYFTEHVFRGLGLDWRSHIFQSDEFIRPSDIQVSLGDPRPMHEEFGWKATIDVDGVISRLLDSKYL